jgi:MFS family permease
MLKLFKSARASYPRQFWLMFWGMIVSTIGMSMLWPFMTLYMYERLKIPLTQTALLNTLSMVVGLAASFIAGPIVDRAGRKRVMVISLIVNAVSYVFMSQASTYVEFAVLMMLNGLINPLYRIGADAMIADLIEPDDRPDAYSLLRMANNIGVAIGPAIGGFIASRSYAIAFLIGAAGLLIYGVLMGLFAHETLPQRAPAEHAHEQPKERFGGYGSILRDKQYMGFIGSITFTTIAAAMVWMLLAVYAKSNFGVPEEQYGWIATTNALMVILFQFGVTQITKKFAPLPVITIGAFLYAIGCGGIVLGQGFWGFWLCMVILTLGELMLQPTASTFVAKLAPADKRGRYMSVYGLTWSVAMGIGPVIGGALNDNLGPVFMWYVGGAVGMLAVVGFALMARRYPEKNTEKRVQNTDLIAQSTEPL